MRSRLVMLLVVLVVLVVPTMASDRFTDSVVLDADVGVDRPLPWCVLRQPEVGPVTPAGGMWQVECSPEAKQSCVRGCQNRRSMKDGQDRAYLIDVQCSIECWGILPYAYSCRKTCGCTWFGYKALSRYP